MPITDLFKKIAFSVLLLAFVLPAFAQDSLNMTLLARWDDNSLPIASPGNLNVQYSGCWGMALNGREYAVLGGALHVLFFDVTDPTSPELIGKFAGQRNTVWREFKSYKDHIYGVSDATTEGLMIFDMSQAPDTVIRTYYSNEFFGSSHTIMLDTASGHIYLNGSNAASMVILDVSQDLDQPQLLGYNPLLGGYVHDSYVRGDTLYASSGFPGLFVYDCTEGDTCKFLAQFETGGYNHNNWMTDDGQYLYYTEEIPAGRPVQIVSLKELNEGTIEGAGSFLDNLLEPDSLPMAIPHNVYINGDLLFNSQYEDGLLVYDISDREDPQLIAYYDTHPQNTQYNTYFGNWGSYPWLPSGTIIAGDMQNGLQLLRLETSISVNEVPSAAGLQLSLSPNPASASVWVGIDGLSQNGEWQMQVFNTQGQLVQTKVSIRTSRLNIQVADWPQGVYFVVVQDSEGHTGRSKLLISK